MPYSILYEISEFSSDRILRLAASVFNTMLTWCGVRESNLGRLANSLNIENANALTSGTLNIEILISVGDHQDFSALWFKKGIDGLKLTRVKEPLGGCLHRNSKFSLESRQNADMAVIDLCTTILAQFANPILDMC